MADSKSDARPKPRGKVLPKSDTNPGGGNTAAAKQRDEVANQQLAAHERQQTQLPPSPDGTAEATGHTASGSREKTLEVERVGQGVVLSIGSQSIRFEGQEELLALQRKIGRLVSAF